MSHYRVDLIMSAALHFASSQLDNGLVCSIVWFSCPKQVNQSMRSWWSVSCVEECFRWQWCASKRDNQILNRLVVPLIHIFTSFRCIRTWQTSGMSSFSTVGLFPFYSEMSSKTLNIQPQKITMFRSYCFILLLLLHLLLHHYSNNQKCKFLDEWKKK